MGIIKGGLSSPNTGFAASFHFTQTACGGFAKPGNVRRNACEYEGGK